ncbi:MAG: OmpA family protein [Bacteroidota bacterium]
MKQLLFVLFTISGLFAHSQNDSLSNELPYSFPMLIRYENNKAAINHINKIRLGNLAEYMLEHPTFKIMIEGHVCCNPPNAKRVSKKRAKFVYKYLKKLDVPIQQMKFLGKSFQEPIVAKEKNDADKDLNRRVVIKIMN